MRARTTKISFAICAFLSTILVVFQFKRSVDQLGWEDDGSRIAIFLYMWFALIGMSYLFSVFATSNIDE